MAITYLLLRRLVHHNERLVPFMLLQMAKLQLASALWQSLCNLATSYSNSRNMSVVSYCCSTATIGKLVHLMFRGTSAIAVQSDCLRKL